MGQSPLLDHIVFILLLKFIYFFKICFFNEKSKTNYLVMQKRWVGGFNTKKNIASLHIIVSIRRLGYKNINKVSRVCQTNIKIINNSIYNYLVEK